MRARSVAATTPARYRVPCIAGALGPGHRAPPLREKQHPRGGTGSLPRYRELDEPARRVGAVLESGDFHPGRSGRNHLRALALSAESDIGPERVEEALKLVDLARAADRRVGTYSLGMRQRLGLAGALLGEPELLILDEPANGLDPAGVHWLRSFMRRFADEGGTVLISSHVLAEVAQTVDQVIIIDRGRLAAIGALDELVGRGDSLEDTYLQLTSSEAS